MPEYLLAIALETDMLEILVNFTTRTEYVDNDLVSVFEHTEDAALDLKNLPKSKGSNYKSVFRKPEEK